MKEYTQQLVSCIKDLVDIVKNYHKGNCCDHDAGICYCGEYSVLDEAERLLKKHEKGILKCSSCGGAMVPVWNHETRSFKWRCEDCYAPLT